jgi:hypothetical protein
MIGRLRAASATVRTASLLGAVGGAAPLWVLVRVLTTQATIAAASARQTGLRHSTEVTARCHAVGCSGGAHGADVSGCGPGEGQSVRTGQREKRGTLCASRPASRCHGLES